LVGLVWFGLVWFGWLVGWLVVRASNVTRERRELHTGGDGETCRKEITWKTKACVGYCR
jgi:hypothetical protein